MRVSTSALFRNQIESLLQKYANINDLQGQVTSGKKILRDSQDPVIAAKGNAIDSYVTQLSTFQRNIDTLNNRLSIAENSTQGAINTLVRTKELITSAMNGTLNSGDRKNIALEVEANFNELLSLANTKDGNGEYIFSGFKGKTKPFIETASGVVYQGDQGERLIQVSPDLSLTYGDSGFDVFSNIKSGNGSFTTNNGPSVNAGTGIISPGSVTDNTSYVPDTYTVTFVTNSSGNLGYNVVGATSGQVIPALPNNPVLDAPDFVSGKAISFNGVEFEISGQPNVGDDFQVMPSTSVNIFTTIKSIATTLKQETFNEVDLANMQNILGGLKSSVDQGFDHVVNYLAEIGTRGVMLDNEEELNNSLSFNNQTALSKIVDVDFTEAVTKLNQEQFALEIAQRSYVKTQSLSLFNIIFS